MAIKHQPHVSVLHSLTMSSFLVKHPLNTHLSLPNLRKPKPWRNSVISASFPDRDRVIDFGKYKSRASLPARDRVIDFGKYKGQMLGTLPSTYLKWVSKKLRARDFLEWAQLADQVLQDPVYNDRIEWEYAERLLTGNVAALNYKSVNTVDELFELSQRFGWDFEDKAAWSRVDFQLLGTSKGGRIPRIKEGSRPAEGRDSGKKNDGKFSVEETRKERRERLRNVRNVDENKTSYNVAEEEARKGGAGSRDGAMPGVYETRKERQERLTNVRNVRNVDENKTSYNVGEEEGRKGGAGSRDGAVPGVYNPFPGRETLLKKVLNRRKIG